MTYRVVQWATGAMGRACLRGALDRRDCEVVGAYVYGDQKVGVDIGELVRRPPIGALATGSIDQIERLEADVVIHAPRLGTDYEAHDDDIVRLLRSGKNVISINGNSFAPAWSSARRSRIEQACVDGQVGFMGAGLNPGFVVDQLAVMATGVCLDVERVSISEVVTCTEMRSPDYVFGLLGFGSVPGTHDPNADSWPPGATLNAMFEEVVASICGQLGFEAARIERAHRMLTTDHALDVGAGTIEAGTVSHLDWCWQAMSGNQRVVELRVAWVMDATHVDERDTATWRIRVDGTPNVNLSFGLELPEALAGRTSVEQLGVAGAVLNAIPALVEAPPGIVIAPPSPWRATS